MTLQSQQHDIVSQFRQCLQHFLSDNTLYSYALLLHVDSGIVPLLSENLCGPLFLMKGTVKCRCTNV